jgi:hypothetical protein
MIRMCIRPAPLLAALPLFAVGSTLCVTEAKAADTCGLAIDGVTTTCTPPPSAEALQSDRKAGLTYELTPNVVLGAKSDWTQGSSAARDSTLGEHFATDRTQSEGSVTGKWGWGNWQFSQGAAAGFSNERASTATSSLTNAESDAAYFRAGPEVRRKFDAGDGKSVEPFAFYNKNIDLNNPVLNSAVQSTLGGGLTVAKPDSYTLNATAGYSESGFGETTTPGDVTGKVSVGVPLQ